MPPNPPKPDELPTRRRDENGLTEAMRNALFTIALAPTINAGVVECVEKGVISSREYYYHHWNKDQYWLNALLPLREQMLGERREYMKQLLEHNHEQFVINLINIANGAQATRGQLRAIENGLAILGYEEFGRRGKIDVSVKASITTAQLTFKEKQAQAQADRHGRIKAHGLLESESDDSGDAGPSRN